MREFASVALFFPVLAAGSLLRQHAHAENSAGKSPIPNASPASVPTSGAPVETSITILQNLELRQASFALISASSSIPTDPAKPTSAAANIAVPLADPAIAPMNLAPLAADPSVLPATDPAVPFPPNAPIALPIPQALAAMAPSLPPLPPLPGITATSTLLASPGVGQGFVTTQWVETWIGGTSQTWIPKTITFHFGPMSPAPLPGKGEIGMGTLTGKAGRTQTIFMGAAPTQAAVWARGVAAAVGVGIAGMVV